MLDLANGLLCIQLLIVLIHNLCIGLVVVQYFIHLFTNIIIIFLIEAKFGNSALLDKFYGFLFNPYKFPQNLIAWILILSPLLGQLVSYFRPVLGLGVVVEANQRLN
jgi:hypothetical protein